MKNLFVVRHGNYDQRGLTDSGKQDIAALGGRMERFVNGSVHIMSSPVNRAYQSAEILAKALGAGEIEKSQWLDTDISVKGSFQEFYPQSYEMGRKIISERSNTDNLVMVTHHEVCARFFPWYLETALGMNARVDRLGLDKGRAYHLDVGNKSVRLL